MTSRFLGTLGMALAACTIAAGALAQSVSPAGASAARKANVSMCIGCHGIPDYRTAFPQVYHVPKIAGQSPQYVVKALQAYRSGERSHPSMMGIARSLSDKDMAELAAYYGGSGK